MAVSGLAAAVITTKHGYIKRVAVLYFIYLPMFGGGLILRSAILMAATALPWVAPILQWVVSQRYEPLPKTVKNFLKLN